MIQDSLIFWLHHCQTQLQKVTYLQLQVTSHGLVSVFKKLFRKSLSNQQLQVSFGKQESQWRCPLYLTSALGNESLLLEVEEISI